MSELVPGGSDVEEPLYPIPSDFEHLRTFEGMDDADCWFIRFGTDASHKTLACGNNTGDIFLWDIDAETGEMPFLKLQWKSTTSKAGRKKKSCINRKRKKSSSTAPSVAAVSRAVRWVSFSPDGNLFLASTDEGKLYVWDVVR
jgi:WD40 repeat protein